MNAQAARLKKASQASDGVIADVTVRAAKRILSVRKARESLLDFTQLMMPDPDDPDDVERSRYVVKHFHKLLAEAMERVEKGEILRLIVAMPPRHGKSQLVSRMFPPWYLGRNPYNHVILTSYNDVLAQDVGRDVRAVFKSPMYSQVFPQCKLRPGSQAADRLQTTEGGLAVFVGAGGTIAGRGGDVVIIDDPVKGSEEADSPTFREKQWQWFTQDVMSRLMTSMGAVVIVMTRWHEDDIVGRLTDPKNPCFSEEEAQNWHILHLPALAEDNDPLRREKGEPLWPERHDAARLRAMQRINPRGFLANYQGHPTPEDGEFFKRDWLVGYRPEELPKSLRYYGASDHALGLKQEHDYSCLMMIGVDEDDVIWVLPEIFWERSPTDQTVEAMIDMMARYKPLTWFAENEHILKSIGPFLYKRMQERQVYTAIEPMSPAKDKKVKAQAIRGRIAMKMVRFPHFAPWWSDALDQMLKFPLGRHDDFVDPLGHIGRGLGQLVRAPILRPTQPKEPRSGTIQWVKAAAKEEARQRQAVLAGGF